MRYGSDKMSGKNLKKLVGIIEDSWYAGLRKEDRDRVVELAKSEGISELQARRKLGI